MEACHVKDDYRHFVWPLLLRRNIRALFLTAAAKEPKGNEKKQDNKPASIAGAWDAEDRFLSMGTLYQPEHAVRTKAAKISAATAPISKTR